MANWQALRQRSLPSDLSCLGRLPRLRGGHLRRSRFALPAVGMPRSISVVAPSGFGKTQLLAFWFFEDRKSVAWGKSGSVRVVLGGRRIIKKKKTHNIKKT